MAEIGLRSGVYRCGTYTIVRQPTGYWWLYLYYNTDAEIMVKQFNTMIEAYNYARYTLRG